ncbi:MAG: helix-turn-helix transcriptional regulator [bacterium]
MPHPTINSSESSILLILKRMGPLSTNALAQKLDQSIPGARQHLISLEQKKLVVAYDKPQTRGRPQKQWSLSEAGHAQFPDRHAEMSLNLIQAAKAIYGTAGLDKMIQYQEKRQQDNYQHILADYKSLAGKVKALAKARDQEGYMAASQRLGDGHYLLTEDHCPICAAATRCQSFCRSELTIFKALFGTKVTVTRQEHIIEGARRCAYEIKRND